MYRLEWIEQIKLRQIDAVRSLTGARISPAVWMLGWTSLLTDISAEMVNSALPAYLVLHLHLSPLQYGVIDGVYNGFAIALLSLLAGYVSDRRMRQKSVALSGYGLSAFCKLGLVAAGSAWSWILLVIGIDRAGKGIRGAPRDALISLHTPAAGFATAFAVHRAMDACGSLLGPIVTFLLLSQLPGAFDAVWVTSFVVAVVGVSVLWLFVPRPVMPATPSQSPADLHSWIPSRSPRFFALAGCGSLLALATISDGFLYLILQQKSGISSGFFPLFYVLTAGAYMLFSVPAGRLADSYGRARIFLCGYVGLALLYVGLLASQHITMGGVVTALLGLGAYYAATEGVLMASASAVIPADRRTSGLAVITTSIGLAKLLSSVVFGWLWQSAGLQYAVTAFMGALLLFLFAAAAWLRRTEHAN